MKILVTGGDGFIGSKYIKAMEDEGHECFSYDLPKHDLRDEHDLLLCVSSCDIVVHFAALADVTYCIKNQLETFDINVKATFILARMCADMKKNLIFISTCCVYGNSLDAEETEDFTKPQACEPYAVSKVAAEALIMGVPYLSYAILRIGTVYGPGQRDALFTAICFNNLQKNEKIFIDGDGKQTRQLVYIDDLIDGIVKATKNFDNIKLHIINLCGTEQTSALDTLYTSEKIFNKKVEVEHRTQRYGQTFEENISISKAEQLLNWKPRRTFEEGMRETYNLCYKDKLK